MSKAGFIIRDAQTEDIAELAVLARRIWQEHYTPIIGAEQVAYMLGLWYTPEVLEQQHHMPERRFLIAERDEKIVAYMQVSPQEGHHFIHKLYVAEEGRGLGIGKALLAEIPQDLPHQLRVNRDNKGSIAFYKSQGFTITAEDVLDIGEGYVMDDYIMVRA